MRHSQEYSHLRRRPEYHCMGMQEVVELRNHWWWCEHLLRPKEKKHCFEISTRVE
jgi:hypothetical protein